MQTCVTESNVDPSQIEKFEKTRDLKNLPDSRELRCYMYCLLRQWGYMKEGSSDTHPEALLEFLERIQPHEFDRYTAMNKKCGNKIKEPCDKAYALNKCWKSNSPEVLDYVIPIQIFVFELVFILKPFYFNFSFIIHFINNKEN